MRVTGKASELSSCSIRYLELRTYHSARPDWSPSVSSSSFLSQRLNASKNLYSKDLYAHYGCVNAIEFSNEGDYLVSGGDDRRVLLWNVDGAMSGSHRPAIMKGEHNSNIFCLSFDSNNTRIFSAGNDEQVIVHDMKTGETLDVFLHREAVYGVSVSPTSDSVFASAGEDGQVLLYDMREPTTTDPVCLAQYYDAFHAVQFHPVEPLFIVTANSRKGVSLWDIRKPKVQCVLGLGIEGVDAVPSSAAVERLFSMGSDILRPKRSALTASNFEKLVFLKGNLHMLNQKKWEEEEEEED
ncbi:DDB1- and CUL4-associated factor 5 [Chionoecetes opilio]|uniref:DDB1- and CUL4-associated factor 5 n=1 Tax=Chionoecetes opilio TaxID=41210 RepID=A0A8J4Y5G2_CHIOP|nr:DDB1- and CUL4-associated factor 5 [Chionoecetes opilio]